MQSKNNSVVIASAGSGKTTLLVNEALALQGNNIAFLSYTNNNAGEIKKRFHQECGGIPGNVDVLTWFTFLLHECARPYQRSTYAKRRLRSIHFPKGRSDRYAKYSNTERYYFNNGDEIYSDKISRFIIDCNAKTNGLVTQRLADIYDAIFIDEFQDLAGYDLEVVETILRMPIRTVLVGDPRQCTYTTNNSAKNRQYRGIGILKLVQKWRRDGLCQISNHSESYRCNQEICDFAGMLFPDMDRAISHNNHCIGHDGVFVITKARMADYVNRFAPAILRYDRKTDTFGYRAMNFGTAKGLEFDRVLIIPHGPIKKYLQTGDVNTVKGSIEKFYVAVTRAKQSVAFLYEGKCAVDCRKWPIEQ